VVNLRLAVFFFTQDHYDTLKEKVSKFLSLGVFFFLIFLLFFVAVFCFVYCVFVFQNLKSTGFNRKSLNSTNSFFVFVFSKLKCTCFNSKKCIRGHKWLTADFFSIFVGSSGLNPKQTSCWYSFYFPFIR